MSRFRQLHAAASSERPAAEGALYEAYCEFNRLVQDRQTPSRAAKRMAADIGDETEGETPRRGKRQRSAARRSAPAVPSSSSASGLDELEGFNNFSDLGAVLTILVQEAEEEREAGVANRSTLWDCAHSTFRYVSSSLCGMSLANCLKSQVCLVVFRFHVSFMKRSFLLSYASMTIFFTCR